MPTEFSPQATKKLPSSGASPRWNWSSGVKLSGPQKKLRQPTSASSGTRAMASSSTGMSCSSWCPGSSSKQKSAGIPSMPQGRAFGSKAPTSSEPASSRKYAERS